MSRNRVEYEYMTEIVRVCETEIPEAATIVEVVERLNQIYETGLPGFIVRSAGLVDVGASSLSAVTSAVIESLAKTSNRALKCLATHQIVGRTISLGPFWNATAGDLHHDQFGTSGIIPDLRVHETTEGAGQVILANAGRLGRNMYDPEQSKIWFRGEDAADNLFLTGLADPDTVNPEVYSGELSAGDKLVFSVAIPPSENHDKAGPVWHRFDTCLTPRSAEVQVLKIGRLYLT